VTVSPAAAAEGDRYPQLLRTARMRWWRLMLGAGVLFVGAVGLVTAAYLAAWATGQSDGAFDDDVLDADTVIGMLTNNLVISMMIPAAVLAVLVVHRESPGWLASVTGRPRWGLLGRLLGLAFAVVLVAFGVGQLLPTDSDITVDTPPAATLAGLLAVVLLTTPLQAAAEEVGFRGYLSQAVASWVSRPVVGAVLAGAVSAVVFAFGHGSQDPWLFGDRLAFGVVASWLAWRTGGLEAPVALHVANNVVSLVYASATGSLEASLLASTLEWQFAVLDIVMMVTFALLADRVVRRGHHAVRRALPPPPSHGTPGSPGALSAPGGVGYPGPRPPTPPPAGSDNPWGMG
jgi:membrane protease YdiL (CAAX protease family)